MGEKKVITISREYAAYGRTVASALAERLGLEFYDRDFVNKTVEESGYAREDIEEEGEAMSRANLWMNTFLNGAATYSSSFDGIYQAQKDVILELAQKPCIIIGRCSDHILKEAGIPSFHIYLYGDVDFRMKRAAELNPGVTGNELKKLIEKRDKLRTNYYRHYTGAEMGDSANYNICLDVGAIGVDRCIDILTEILGQ